jgi:diketogulonate reductase-like aldo/keto reductase
MFKFNLVVFRRKNDIFNNETLKTIAVKYNKSVAQIILRWLTQRGIIAIPKSVRKERMKILMSSLLNYQKLKCKPSLR